MLHPFYDLYDQGRADARADVIARAPHRDNASKPHAYQVGYCDGRVVALQMADRGELTLAELDDAGSLHTAPELYLEATEAGMQYSLVPPPASKTRKGETQGRLF